MSIEAILARIAPDPDIATTLYRKFRMQMATPPRAYHNERHISDVLETIHRWSASEPSLSLIAAALYHDVIYDATRPDNELQSAVFCHEELSRIGIPVIDIIRTTSLILATTYHRPHLQNPDEVTLVDADLYILGSTPEEYAAYVQAIRTEYSHVSDEAWRTGRSNVMRRFLERERIYCGNWDGRGEREAQARANEAEARAIEAESRAVAAEAGVAELRAAEERLAAGVDRVASRVEAIAESIARE